MSVVTYARLRVAEPGRWQSVARAWRALATWTGLRGAEFGPHQQRLRGVWSGTAARAADTGLRGLRRRLDLARLIWWEADQVWCEFAAELAAAKALLTAAVVAAEQAGLTIDPDGTVSAGPAPPTTHQTARSAADQTARGAADQTARSAADQTARSAAEQDAAVRQAVTALDKALAVATRADATAARRLVELATPTVATPSTVPLTPACDATPAAVLQWWRALTPAQRRGLLAVEPEVVAALDGVPATARDLANRLLLDDRRAELDRWIADAHGSRLHRLRGLRAGLDALADRLADATAPRAYLLRFDLSGEGRVVVALGDPDRADSVLTHVPGMTAGLASLGGEWDRVGRVAARARQLAPETSTSAVLWLDYDAPDSLGEAAGTGRAAAGADGLRQFQDGLRATHQGPPAHQTVLGHSYGSLVVGMAATREGFAADDIVFVGSPGVGVETAAQLHVPAGQVWSTTSRSDVIQYAAVSPGSLLSDLGLAARVPILGPALAFGLPEDDLWHGHNPSDAGFGARVFASQNDAGHLGYWDPGRPALDDLARITLGGAYQAQVR